MSRCVLYEDYYLYLQCAILSPTFRVRDFSITDAQPYPIKLHWQGGMDEEGYGHYPTSTIYAHILHACVFIAVISDGSPLLPMSLFSETRWKCSPSSTGFPSVKCSLSIVASRLIWRRVTRHLTFLSRMLQ